MRLFEHFTSILCPSSNPEKPFVTLFFPHDKILESHLESGEEKEKVKQKHKEDLASIPQFCFPDSDPFADSEEVQAKKGESERFAFVLTDSDGSKRFAFCRRTVDVSSAKALCLVSKNPWFEFFDQVLSFIEGQQKTLITENTIVQILEKVYTYRAPSPGETISLQFNLAEISAPVGLGYSDFGDVPFSYLITSLKARNIVKLIASMVCERRIIISSIDLPKLSFTVMALYAALYPFAWHNILIPLLPESLLHYCCAPMPFLVGIHSDSLLALEAMPLEELVFVDLDYDRVASAESFDDDITLLPSPAVNALKANLKGLRSATKKSGSCDNQGVAKSFLHFWISIFGNYKQFMTPNDKGFSFDRDGFEAAQGKSYQKFVATFKESQMFEQFVRGIEENRPSMAQFESTVALVEQQKQDGTYEPIPQSGSGSFLSMVGSRASSLGNTIANLRKKDSTRELDKSDEGTEDIEKEKKDKKGKKFQEHWKDVRSAIKDVMDLKYTKSLDQENSSDGSPAPVRPVRRSTKVYTPVELSSALQNIEEGPKGIMSQQSMVELRKRLSVMPMYNSNAQGTANPPTFYKPNMYRQSSFVSAQSFQSQSNNTREQSPTPYSYTPPAAAEPKKPPPDRVKELPPTPPRASVIMKPQSNQSSPNVTAQPQVIVPPRSNSSDNIPVTTINPNPKMTPSRTVPGGATPPRAHTPPHPDPPSPEMPPSTTSRPPAPGRDRASMAPGRIRASQLNLSSTHPPPSYPSRTQPPPQRGQPPFAPSQQGPPQQGSQNPPPQQGPPQQSPRASQYNLQNPPPQQNPQNQPPQQNPRASQYNYQPNQAPPPYNQQPPNPQQQSQPPPQQNPRASQYNYQPNQAPPPYNQQPNQAYPQTPRPSQQNNVYDNTQQPQYNQSSSQNPQALSRGPMPPPRQSSLVNMYNQPPQPGTPQENTRGAPQYTQPPQYTQQPSNHTQPSFQPQQQQNTRGPPPQYTQQPSNAPYTQPPMQHPQQSRGPPPQCTQQPPQYTQQPPQQPSQSYAQPPHPGPQQQNTRGPPPQYSQQPPQYTQQPSPSYTQPPQPGPPQQNTRGPPQHTQQPPQYTQQPQPGYTQPQGQPSQQPNNRASQYHHQAPHQALPPAPTRAPRPKPQPGAEAPITPTQTSVDDGALPVKKQTPRPPPRQSASLRDIPTQNYVPETTAEAKFIQDLESRSSGKQNRPMTFSPQLFKELESRKQLVDPASSSTTSSQQPAPTPGRKPLPKPPGSDTNRSSVN